MPATKSSLTVSLAERTMRETMALLNLTAAQQDAAIQSFKQAEAAAEYGRLAAQS
jgi:hypothetical protein